MYASMLLLALTGTPAADATESQAWMTDYVQARKLAASEGKPWPSSLPPVRMPGTSYRTRASCPALLSKFYRATTFVASWTAPAPPVMPGPVFGT